MSSEILISVKNISKSYRIFEKPAHRFLQSFLGSRKKLYREAQVLSDVSFDIKKGETVGIVGVNGAGKSTLLGIISGVLAQTSGEVEISGRITALLSLGAGFVQDFTGRENVFLNGAMLGLSRKEVEDNFDNIAAFADIGDYMDQPVKTYSSGMYSRLAFAVAVHTSPSVLIIDETLSVGDEAFQRKCFARLDRMKADGVTILFVSHSAGAVLELCDRAILLVGGKRVLTASPKEVISRYQKLIYAKGERRREVLQEIEMLDRGGQGQGNISESAKVLKSTQEAPENEIFKERYEEKLQPQSTVSYISHGAQIKDVCILTKDGGRVNVLNSDGAYFYTYRVAFTVDAMGVRFSFMLKSITGVELGVLWTTPRGAGETVSAGDVWEIRFPFKLPFREGSYFGNAGVTGFVDGEYITMHRIIDATMFKVLPQRKGHGDRYINLASPDGAIEVRKAESA